ncbi:hypothetical protein HHI36_018493 [Cryptolaemus montrouzieri]|uniref:Uncharacterized protein n=1 Tax=Cryptolaemus montrouzieri TaxID=559131 RepID=A0ABD2P0C0_9CUCU
MKRRIKNGRRRQIMVENGNFQKTSKYVRPYREDAILIWADYKRIESERETSNVHELNVLIPWIKKNMECQRVSQGNGCFEKKHETGVSVREKISKCDKTWFSVNQGTVVTNFQTHLLCIGPSSVPSHDTFSLVGRLHAIRELSIKLDTLFKTSLSKILNRWHKKETGLNFLALEASLPGFNRATTPAYL